MIPSLICSRIILPEKAQSNSQQVPRIHFPQPCQLLLPQWEHHRQAWALPVSRWSLSFLAGAGAAPSAVLCLSGCSPSPLIATPSCSYELL